MEGAERCRSLPTSAGKWLRLLSRHFGRWRELAQLRQIAMVRKGSPVRVRQRAPRKAPLRRGFFARSCWPGVSNARGPHLGRIVLRSAIGAVAEPRHDRGARRGRGRASRACRSRTRRHSLPHAVTCAAARPAERAGRRLPDFYYSGRAAVERHQLLTRDEAASRKAPRPGGRLARGRRLAGRATSFLAVDLMARGEPSVAGAR